MMLRRIIKNAIETASTLGELVQLENTVYQGQFTPQERKELFTDVQERRVKLSKIQSTLRDIANGWDIPQDGWGKNLDDELVSIVKKRYIDSKERLETENLDVSDADRIDCIRVLDINPDSPVSSLACCYYGDEFECYSKKKLEKEQFIKVMRCLYTLSNENLGRYDEIAEIVMETFDKTG